MQKKILYVFLHGFLRVCLHPFFAPSNRWLRVKTAWAAILFGAGEPTGVKRFKLSTVSPMRRRLFSAFKALSGCASLGLMLDFARRFHSIYIFSHYPTIDFF
jgi:hypothetical protein